MQPPDDADRRVSPKLLSSKLRSYRVPKQNQGMAITQRSNIWTQYTSLRGRISRKKFWLWFLVPIAVFSLLSTSLDVSQGGFGPDWFPWQVSGPVSFTIALLMLWALMVGWVKRLHDRDITGKHVAALYGSYVLLFGLGPDWYPGGVFSPTGFAGTSLLGLTLIAWNVYLWYLVVLGGFLRGTEGPNRYGPDALQGSADG